MINEIYIGTEAFKGFKCIKSLKDDALQNLSRVNIFIGPNNSGKSRFLRALFYDNELGFSIEGIDISNINNLIAQIKGRGTGRLNANLIQFVAPIGGNGFDDLTNDNYLKIIDSEKSILEKNLHTINDLIKSVRRAGYEQALNDTNSELAVLKDLIEKRLLLANKDSFERYYIPILRGLRPVQINNKWNDFQNNEDPYLNRTFVDYFKPERIDGKQTEPTEIIKKIFTGLEIYKDVKDKLLNTKDKRNQIEEFESFIRKNFFPDKEISLIPKIDQDALMIDFGGDDERMIYDLGDGIQAIIQMLYPIFMRKGENALFFIEEPELSLHPGMQRLFINTLLSDEFASMQFFFTTHSNHFLDMTNDNENISIYSFNKNQKGDFEIRNLEGPENHVLNDIGVRNSSVFLANCSIWVEGVTDRKYIRRFLEVFNSGEKKYIEDLHYTFVEYGGSNIVHWDFDDVDKQESKSMNALRLNNKIFLIADSDIVDGKPNPTKSKRHDGLRAALKNDFYLTEGKEIENMLSPQIVNKVVQLYEKRNPIEFTKDINSSVTATSFNNNTQIKKPIYWKYNLGAFIDEYLINKIRKTYAEENSVLGKEAFCEKAIKSIRSKDDLSEEAITLCEKLMKFIGDSNK
jgi:AAA15 family ATPase/GTPase